MLICNLVSPHTIKLYKIFSKYSYGTIFCSKIMFAVQGHIRFEQIGLILSGIVCFVRKQNGVHTVSALLL
jgi:hypothetical protein